MGIQTRSVLAQILKASEAETFKMRDHCATICLQQNLNVFAKTANACLPWRHQTENMPG